MKKCPACRKTAKPIWLKQQHVVVQRCRQCNQVWPFGRAKDRDPSVQLEILAADIVTRGVNLGQPEAMGWATHAQESHGWPEILSLPVSEDTAWHAGWLAREILHGADAELQASEGPTTGVPSSTDPEVAALVRESDRGQRNVSAGLAEMERIWDDVKRQSDEMMARDDDRRLSGIYQGSFGSGGSTRFVQPEIDIPGGDGRYPAVTERDPTGSTAWPLTEDERTP